MSVIAERICLLDSLSKPSNGMTKVRILPSESFSGTTILNDLENITKTITRFFKKININNPEVLKIINLLKHDKKAIKGKINFVLINQIGMTKIDILVDDKLIKESFDFYNSLS